MNAPNAATGTQEPNEEGSLAHRVEGVAWVVFWKELKDAARDRRTLLLLLLSAVALGPFMLFMLSGLAAEAEQRAQAREVLVSGLKNGPTLVNYLERQSYTALEAPSDHEQQLQSNRLTDPVLLIPPEFEADLARGEPARLVLLSASANTRAEAGTGQVLALLQGFSQERSTLRLALRGVAPALAQPLAVSERDLARPAARASRVTAMIPLFVLMAVLYGAMNAALDTTAGERERGSLEPLLMNPASHRELIRGKWAAVAVVGMAIAVLCSASFLPGQWLLRSPTLAAMFHYGWEEMLVFWVILLPLAGALAAVLMAVAILGRSVKEAQAWCALVAMGMSLLPLISLLGPNGEQRWHLLMPALGQSILMTRVLRGEPMNWLDMALALTVCGILMLLALSFLERQVRRVLLD